MGRFTLWHLRCDHCGTWQFQSRNRVWAGSRLHRRPAPNPPRSGFNLAIEFGPVHALDGLGVPIWAHMFQSRNRVWAGSRTTRPSSSPSDSWFQSRNRVWAGSRIEAAKVHIDFVEVSISQSSLGRFTHFSPSFLSFRLLVSISQSSLGRFTPAGWGEFQGATWCFNLAIEFGPVHASAKAFRE